MIHSEKIFATYITIKQLVYRRYEDLLQINKKTHKPIDKWAKDMDSQLMERQK